MLQMDYSQIIKSYKHRPARITKVDGDLAKKA